MFLHANISDTPFDQKSPQTPEEGVLKCHKQTDRHATDGHGHEHGHGDSLTEYAQWANSVKMYMKFSKLVVH